jgi:hypothetical protein
MDAILDEIEKAILRIGVYADDYVPITPKPWGGSHKQPGELSSGEKARARSAENHEYKLQVDDGVCLAHHGNRHGVIRSISGDDATVGWILPRGGCEVETLPLEKLDFMPTLEQIYGKDPSDPHTVRDDNCITARIQREWDESDERHHNCHPNPPSQPVAKLNHVAQVRTARSRAREESQND